MDMNMNMSTKNFLSVALLAAPLSVIGYNLTSTGAATLSTATTETTPRAHQETARGDDTALASQVQSLRQQMRAMRLQLAETAAAAPVEEEEEPASVVNEEERAEAQAAWRAAYLADVDEQFARQQVDLDWSPTAETDAAAALAEVAGDAEVSIECHSALCKAEIVHQDASGHQSMSDNIIGGFSWTGPALVWPSDADGPAVTTVYLARPGSELPEPSPMPTGS